MVKMWEALANYLWQKQDDGVHIICDLDKSWFS
jgi:hypothetical protein